MRTCVIYLEPDLGQWVVTFVVFGEVKMNAKYPDVEEASEDIENWIANGMLPG